MHFERDNYATFTGFGGQSKNFSLNYADNRISSFGQVIAINIGI